MRLFSKSKQNCGERIEKFEFGKFSLKILSQISLFSCKHEKENNKKTKNTSRIYLNLFKKKFFCSYKFKNRNNKETKKIKLTEDNKKKVKIKQIKTRKQKEEMKI